MTRFQYLGIVVGFAAGIPSGANAQAAPPLKLIADLGFVSASGNTSVTTVTVGQTLTYTQSGWRLSQYSGALYGRTDGEKSAEQLRFGGRIDFRLSDGIEAFLLAGWDRNHFSGIDRRFEEGIGLAFRVTGEGPALVELEIGAGATQQENTQGASTTFATGRAATRYRQSFTEKAFFQQTVEFLPNLENSDDYRVVAESSLVAPLVARLSVKASFLLKYDNFPEFGFERTDRTITTGLQFSL